MRRWLKCWMVCSKNGSMNDPWFTKRGAAISAKECNARDPDGRWIAVRFTGVYDDGLPAKRRKRGGK